MATTVKVKAPNDPSHRYNTATGKLNPNYKAPSTSKDSSGSESVKALQKYLNMRGANLKVDGIAGPLTKAAQAKYGVPSTSTGGKSSYGGGMSKPGQNMTYANAPKFSYSSPSPTKKTAVGSFLSKVGSSFKNAINTSPKKSLGANALYATVGENMTDEETTRAYTALGSTVSGTETGFENIMGYPMQMPSFSDTPTKISNAGLVDVNGIPLGMTAVNDSVDLTSLMTSPGLTYDDKTSNSGDTISTDPIGGGGTTTDTLTDPLREGDVNSQSLGAGAGSTYSAYDAISKNNPMGVNTSNNANPWTVNSGNGDEFTGQNRINYPKQVANLFQDYQTADDWFNTDPEGRVAKADLEKKGYTVDDVLKNIVPTKNGIRPPQTWNEFNTEIQKLSLGDQKEYIDYMNSKFNGINPSLVDTTGMTPELKAMAESQNKMMIEQSKYLNEQQKMSWTNSYLDRIEAEKEIKAAEEMLLKRETAIEDRLRFNTKKMKAEMKAQEAEDEKARINGMNYMTGYLAKIGALDVSSSAAFGLNALETKYQEQKAANRQKYLFAIEEMELDANEKINNLQYDLEKSKLEISRDLSKDERHVRADMFKLDYDYKIKALEINTQYQERLMIAKEKQKSDSNKANNDWRNAFFTISAGDMFASLPAEFRNTWLRNNQISPEGFKTTQEDLAKDFGNWSKSQPNNTGVTDATRTKVLKYLKKENGKDLIGYEEDIAAFDSDPSFRNMILGSIE